MALRYDVVVVGARAAGAATALLLARSGLTVLVLDRCRYGADTLSTHALARAGVLQLSRWGLLDRIVAAGTPPIRQTTFRYAGEVIPIRIKPTPGVDALYAPRRTVLDRILVDAAVEAGAGACFGATVTDVVRTPRGRVIGVRGRTSDGRPIVVEARLVVGADGVSSTIARRVQARVERVGSGVTACTYGYWSGLETDGSEWNFRPDAVSGVIPTNDGQACVFASALPARIGRGGLDVLMRIAARSSPELAARLAIAEAPSAMRTFRGRPGHMLQSFGPGWALVGDAGHYKDPLSAHGLTDALRDAELLARAVTAVVAAGADETEALAAYQHQRDGLSAAMFDVIDVIAAHHWTDAEIGPLLRQLSAATTAELEALSALPIGGRLSSDFPGSLRIAQHRKMVSEPRGSDQAALVGPGGELVAVGQLQLA